MDTRRCAPTTWATRPNCGCEEAVALRARVAELGQAAAELACTGIGGMTAATYKA